MAGKFIAILFSLALLAAASAEKPAAVFDMDSSGNAQMTVAEAMDLASEEMSVSASADSSGITFTGMVTDSASAQDVDYSLDIALQGSTATITFSFTGSQIEQLLSGSGSFSLTGEVRDDAGTLNLDLTGTLPGKLFEDQLLLNATLIEADKEGFRTELEGLLNDAFASLQFSPTPTVSVTAFDLSGSDTLTLHIALSISDWNDFVATLMSMGYSSAIQGANFLNCLGTTPESVTAAMLGTGMSASFSMSTSAGALSGRADITSTTGAPLGGVALDSFNVHAAKSGARTDFSGSAAISDVPTFLSCAMKDYLPGQYTVEDLRYTLLKTPDSGVATQTLESKIDGLASKSNGNLQVSFLSDLTDNLNITVNVPSGTSIISVNGGVQDGRSALSTGGDFSVTYGKSGGMDMLWVGAIIVVVLLLAALLMRRRPSGAKAKRSR